MSMHIISLSLKKKGNCLGKKIATKGLDKIHMVTFHMIAVRFLHIILLVDFMGRAGEMCIISREKQSYRSYICRYHFSLQIIPFSGTF